MTELSDCPFCGAELNEATHPGAITDDDCLFSGKVIEPDDFDKWNRRAVGEALSLHKADRHE